MVEIGVVLKVDTKHDDKTGRDFRNYILNVGGYDIHIKNKFDGDERLFKEVINQLAIKAEQARK